jgi:hypothetical protein
MTVWALVSVVHTWAGKFVANSREHPTAFVGQALETEHAVEKGIWACAIANE